MAFHLYEDTWETSTTTGTGAYTLAGAVTGWRTFSSQYSTGDTCYYSAYDGTNFEHGIGTYTTSGNTLARTTIYRSTNSNAAVSWSAGTRQIVVAPLGITLESHFVPGSAGVPQRTADNIWSYISTSPTQTIFTSGSGTYTVPAGVKWIRVRMVAGGGGGSYSTSGGTAATAGGNTTFGTSLLTCNGGALGPYNNTGGPGGAGGTSTGGDINFTGQSGGPTYTVLAAVANEYGGAPGGDSILFGGGGQGAGGGTGNTAVANTGGGGQGAGGTTNQYSQSGGGGGGSLEKIITSPSATYSYSVGAAGAAGTNGGGQNGGAGAAGIIIVEEHYNY